MTASSKGLQDDAVAIRAEAENLFQCNYSAGVAEADPQPASSLYLAHYSSLQAIISMLQAKGGGLRLSDSSTMNDPEEGCTTPDGRSFIKRVEGEFAEDAWPRRRYTAAHICCFVGTTRRNDEVPAGGIVDVGNELLYWRLYGNDCRGVSITIPPHKSKELVETLSIQRVVYSDEVRSLSTDWDPALRLLRRLDALRTAARSEGVWARVRGQVLPQCDRLFGQRFLHKRSHYAVEQEYRAVQFVADDDDGAAEDTQFCGRGWHVQYGRVRTYVQVPELACESIFTTDSQITIGSNVPDAMSAQRVIEKLLRTMGLAPGVVSTQVSEIPYRAR